VNSFAIAGLVIWVVFVIIALLVVMVSAAPGYRRRRSDPNYTGPERRAKPVSSDVFEQPLLRRHPDSEKKDTENGHDI
jgi:hypothetical protein